MHFRRKIKPHNTKHGLYFVEVRLGMEELRELLEDMREDLGPEIGLSECKLDVLYRGLQKQYDHLAHYSQCTPWEEPEEP